MGFPTKNDHFGVFWGYGYHHFRKPRIYLYILFGINQRIPWISRKWSFRGPTRGFTIRLASTTDPGMAKDAEFWSQKKLKKKRLDVAMGFLKWLRCVNFFKLVFVNIYIYIYIYMFLKHVYVDTPAGIFESIQHETQHDFWRLDGKHVKGN